MLKDMLETAPQRRLLSFNSSAEYCGVTQQTIRRLMARGVLTPVRLPEVRRILFDRQDLDRLIESGKAADTAADETMPLTAVGVENHGSE
jgi:excisionase family DNA binding protein